jgi:hypothetical protein
LLRAIEDPSCAHSPAELLNSWPRALALLTVRIRLWELLATHATADVELTSDETTWIVGALTTLPMSPLTTPFARERDRAALRLWGRVTGEDDAMSGLDLPLPPVSCSPAAMIHWAARYSCHVGFDVQDRLGQAVMGRDLDVARAAVLAAAQHRVLTTARVLMWLPHVDREMREELVTEVLEPLRRSPATPADALLCLGITRRRLAEA